MVLSAAGYLEVVRRLAEVGLAGGRVFDAVVASSAAEAGFRLLTADQRALPVYALVGAEVELLRT